MLPAGVHRRMGEQDSGTARLLRSCTGEGELSFFGKRSARLLKLFITGRLPSKSGGAVYRRLQRHLLRPVVNNVVINNVTAATSSSTPPPPPPPDRYMRHISICLAMDVVLFALLLFMLINASSMFEFHMLVVVVVMLNVVAYSTVLQRRDPHGGEKK